MRLGGRPAIGDLAVNLLVYALVLAYAVWMGWKSDDFVWAFWFAGVITIMASEICAGFLDQLAERKAGTSAFAAIFRALGKSIFFGVIATLLVVIVVFAPLAAVLNAATPLVPWSRLWPFVAGICAARLWTIFSVSGVSGGRLRRTVDAVSTLEMFRTIAVVVLAIISQMVLAVWNKSLATYANYLLLALFLFPWTIVFDIKTPAPNT